MSTEIDTSKLMERTTYFLGLMQKKDDVLEKKIPSMMQELGELITQHNTLYYTAQPVISDKEYDDLFRLLTHREEIYPDDIHPNSPSQKMNISVQSSFQKKDHGGHRLLSLKNSYNAEDLLDRNDFLQRQIGEEEYTFIVEPKFDGSSVHLVYEYGHFVAGITRGDGEVGEDITENMKAVHNLPLYLDALKHIAEVRLRGEVMMSKTAFATLNEQQIATGGTIFANERNATAGTLRQLDPWIVKKRGLVVYILDLIDWLYTEKIHTTDTQRKNVLISRGLPFFSRKRTYGSIDDVVALCEDQTIKDELYATGLLFDGLVIKLNELSLRKKLGATDHHPRRAMAFKYPATQTTTTIRDITYQIGRTGVITPVAELEPVHLSGAMISRATLHNFDMIEKMDVKIGDAVWIQRSGEVIPYIIGPVIERRTGNEQDINLPNICPYCETTLIRNEGEVALLCPNMRGCLAQKKEQLKHLVAKSCMNITGLGDALIEQLVDAGILVSWPDIFLLGTSLYSTQLRALPGIADKKIKQLQQEIEQAKNMELWRGLHAFGIPFVGKKIARLLQTYIASSGHEHITIDVLVASFVSNEKLEDIFGLGPQTIHALHAYFSDEHMLAQLRLAYDYGFSLHIPSTKQTSDSQKLLGENIVLTGSFPIPRDAVADILTIEGARVTSAISNATTCVIYGDRPGSKKIKAQQQGIETISLEKIGREKNIQAVIDLFSKEEKENSQAVSLF